MLKFEMSLHWYNFVQIERIAVWRIPHIKNASSNAIFGYVSVKLITPMIPKLQAHTFVKV